MSNAITQNQLIGVLPTVLLFALAIALYIAVLKVSDRHLRVVLSFIAPVPLILSGYTLIHVLGVFGIVITLVITIRLYFSKWLDRENVFLGIFLAVLAFVCALCGVLAGHEDMSPLERYSTAFYEAAQLPLLNMNTHDETKTSWEERVYFALARTFASLLALYLAYKTFVYFWNLADTRLLLNLYRFKWWKEKKLALVIGLGSVGSELVRSLVRDKHRVIAIEFNEDNKRIKELRKLGIRITVDDATREELYDFMPFDALQNIYVVTGDDQRNFEIGQLLKNISRKRIEAARARKNWLNRLLHRISHWCLRDEPSIVYVQLYDSNMQSLMDRKHFGQAIDETHIELRHFNAQQNAVRDFIVRELSLPEIRPTKDLEVAVYFVIGFDSLGQDVALGLAQLAHFENLKRSRIVVFSNNSKLESEQFLKKHPKFTRHKTPISDWNEIYFDPSDDTWETCRGQHGESGEGEPRINCGVDFAANAVFTDMPASPSDESFLELVYRLTNPTLENRIRPVLLVCHKDWKESFAWSSEFVDVWKSYCLVQSSRGRSLASDRPRLPTYFWLQEHRAIRDLVKDNADQKPFGLEEFTISKSLIDGNVLGHIGRAVEVSYMHATNEDPGQIDGTASTYEFLQSNLQAASHSLIKYQIAGRDIRFITNLRDLKFPLLEAQRHFRLGGFLLHDVNRGDNLDDDTIQCTLGRVEHNRWMADQLLKRFDWIPMEPDRNVHGQRLPEYKHLRDTLCGWNCLNSHDKLKDIRQSYYVLYHLSEIENNR